MSVRNDHFPDEQGVQTLVFIATTLLYVPVGQGGPQKLIEAMQRLSPAATLQVVSPQ